MAYKIDTTFTFAAFYLAFTYCFNGEFGENLSHWTRRAHELKNNLPPAYRPWIELWYSCYIDRDVDDIRRYCDLLFDATLHSRFILFDLGVTYDDFLQDYKRSIQAFERLETLNQKWEDPWKYDSYYEQYTKALLRAHRPEEVERIADIGLIINPKNELLIIRKGTAAIMMGDSAYLQRCSENLRSLVIEKGYSEWEIELKIGDMHRLANDYRGAVDLYRRSYELNKEDLRSLFRMVYCQLKSDMNIEECLRLSEYLLEKEPENGGFLWAKGSALHKLGRDREALKFLLEANEYSNHVEIQRDLEEVERSLAAQEQ